MRGNRSACTDNSYSPDIRAEKLKSPRSEVVSVRASLVARLTTVRRAPDTGAPEGSRTRPASVPVGICAAAIPANTKHSAAIFIFFPSRDSRDRETRLEGRIAQAAIEFNFRTTTRVQKQYYERTL